VFGLVRAGYTVLTLSPRLSPPAILKLLDETQCHCLLYNGVSYLNMVVDAVSAQGTIQSLPILNRGGYESVENVEHFPSKDVNRSEEQNKVVVVMHSSGSTGLPKPIYTTNKRYTIPSLPAPGTKDMITLPL